MEFLEILGIKTETESDLNGECAVLYEDERRLVLCEQLCDRRRMQAVNSALTHLGLA